MRNFRLDSTVRARHSAGMRKRRVIILASAIVAMLGLVWWALVGKTPPVPDPVYAGHRLSFWTDRTQYGFDPVVRSLDSNAVPYLVYALQRQDGPLRKAYRLCWEHMPRWLQSRAANPAVVRRMVSCFLLASLGKNARPAIPELIRNMRKDDDLAVRASAAEALGKIANGDNKQVVEALVATATEDPSIDVMDEARVALRHIAPEAAVKAGLTNWAWETSPTNSSASAVQ